MKGSHSWRWRALGATVGASLLGCAGAQVKADHGGLASARSPARAAPSKATPVAVALTPALVAPMEDPSAAGQRAFAEGHWDEAEKQFQAAVKRAPKDARAWHNLGAAASRQHDFAAAERAYKTALALDPTFAPSLVQLAQLYRSNERLDQEVSLLESATRTPAFAQRPDVLVELATAYHLKKDDAQAEATCRKVLARSQDDVSALGVLAQIYLDQGNVRLAGFVAAKASRLAPSDARLHNDLGLIALKLGRTEVALAELRRAVELDPTFVPGYQNLGALALRYRDYTSASQDFAKVVALRPDDPHAHLAYAWALDGARAQDPSQAPLAGAEYEKALALAPESGDALCGAAWAYAADPSTWDKAKPLLTRCKGAEGTVATEKARVDAKLQAIALAQSAPTQPKEETGVGGSGEAPAQSAAGPKPAPSQAGAASNEESAPNVAP